VTRGNRSAALACLAVALLAQLLLPAMHAAVHARERHGGGHHHGGEGERAWVITKAGARVVAAPHEGEHRHGGVVHRHEAPAATTPRSRPAPLALPEAPFGLASSSISEEEHDAHGAAGHHHDGDQPGGRHGAHTLEHLTAFFLEATPPALAVPYDLVAPAVVPLVAGRLVPAPIDRAQPVRGPPRQS
jgi:hypothetical protein